MNFLEHIKQSLVKERLDPSDCPFWLSESWEEPASFRSALMAERDFVSPWKSKSIPFAAYDFYHDIVSRNRWNHAPAFSWFDPDGNRQDLSYEALGALASEKAWGWSRAGVSPGQTICIIGPMGPEFPVRLLAGLKMGLILSFLPPKGYRFLKKRLETLSPDHIEADPLYAHLLPRWKERLLSGEDFFPEKPGGEDQKEDIEQSRVYDTGMPLFRIFDPASETPHTAVEVTTDTAYLNPLRDGMIALGLTPGKTLAAPGFHFSETQPGLLLAVLLNGGTYLHLSTEQIAEDPQMVTKTPLAAMGVDSGVRDILQQSPVDAGSAWSFWFRNPADGKDMVAWQTFLETMRLESVPTANLKWDPLVVGCSLFSEKRKGQLHPLVWPGPADPWLLTDFAGTGSEVPGDTGRLTIKNTGLEEYRVRPFLLTRIRSGFNYIGAVGTGRKGRTLPREEVAEAFADLPFGKDSAMVDVPRADEDPLIVMVVFTRGMENIDEGAVIRGMEDCLNRESDPDFLPDRIVFFPLFPRYDPSGAVDAKWCREQYLSGGLRRKAGDELVRCIVRLKRLVYE